MLESFKNQILLGDCLDILKNLPDNSIDMVFTDPPYGISKEITITRGRNKMKFRGSDINLDFGQWDNFNSLKDYWGFTFAWINECVRVLKPGRILSLWFDRDKINFVSYYLQKKFKFKFKGYFAMIKSNPVPQARKVKWSNGWEEIGLWQKPGGSLVYNYQLGQHPDYMIVPIVGHTTVDGKRIHPTQKPVRVAELFVSYWTKEEEIVLDPFTGSGTIPVACILLNRNYIAIEKEKKYYNAAVKRIEEIQKQGKLFK